MRSAVPVAFAVLVCQLSLPGAGELPRHEPRLATAEGEGSGVGYDPTLVDPEDAARVAEYLHSRFGAGPAPDVYGIPGRADSFLVSAGQGDTEDDFGARFFLVERRPGAFRLAFRGRGAGDSYILHPTFFTGDARILILAETGTEYTWGLEAYEFEDGALSYLGSLDVAHWTGENYANPLERASVHDDAGSFRVEFHTDLVLNPGGVDTWVLPRTGRAILYRQDGAGFVLQDGISGRQACFFRLGDGGTDASDEPLADLAYYYDKLIPWLERKGVSHSFQTEAPLRMVPIGGGQTVIEEGELEGTLGVVLLGPQGRRRVLYGVHTDVELVGEMGTFFEIPP